jgi:RNA exonuclease NGL2
LPAQEELLRLSRVVHRSIEPDKVPLEAKKEPADEEEDAEKDPDKIITNARIATPDDGLLSTRELVEMLAPFGSLKSSYDRGQKTHKAAYPISTFGDRVPTDAGRRGRFEPEWTSYTHYWKTVLGEARRTTF